MITQHLKKSPLHLAVLLGIGAASAALPSYAQDESSKSEEMERIEIKNSYTTRVMNYSTARGFSIDNVQFDGANVRGAYGGVEGDFLSDMAVYERV